MSNPSNFFSTGIVSHSLFDDIYHDFLRFVEDVNLMSRFIVEMVPDDDAVVAGSIIRTLSEIEQERLKELLAKGENEKATAGGNGVCVVKAVDHVESAFSVRTNPQGNIKELKRLQNVQ